MPLLDPIDLVTMPRLGDLALSPDGRRLVAAVGAIDSTGAATSVLWEFDPDGANPARQLTFGPGDSSPKFTEDGRLLFMSTRTVPGDDQPTSRVWFLPDHGAAYPIAARSGGFADFRTAGGVIVAAGDVDDPETPVLAGSSALLYDRYPIRTATAWRRPRHQHLFVGRISNGPEPLADLKDLTPDAGDHLDGMAFDVSPDGATVATTWKTPGPIDRCQYAVLLIDIATGERRTVWPTTPDALAAPSFSPDGRFLAVVVDDAVTPEHPPRTRVAVIDLATGEQTWLATDLDGPVYRYRWTPDSAALVAAPLLDGSAPIVKIPRDPSERAEILATGGFNSSVILSPDQRAVFAVRQSLTHPRLPIRVDLASGAERVVPSPIAVPELPGRIEPIAAPTGDGETVHGWLALPASAGEETPAPLVVFVHGGPSDAWGYWFEDSWNPWPLVAQGYAVALPNPAMSLGYGQRWAARGWGHWGREAYTDVMDFTEHSAQRPDIDAERLALAGGSFGGYLANWIAGHTDRFRAIVTEASLWSLGRLPATSDMGFWQTDTMTDAARHEYSPHRFAGQIATPMLVIAESADFRSPNDQSLELFHDLVAASGDDQGVSKHRFLCFPGVGHMAVAGPDAVAWYRVVTEFLASHLS